MSNLTDPFREIFLAGIGALSIGAEKTQEIVEQLVKQGQITADQGKDVVSDLQSKAKENASKVRDDIIAAQMKTMTKEERDEFVARVAEMAANVDGDEAQQAQEAAEIEAAGKATE